MNINKITELIQKDIIDLNLEINKRLTSKVTLINNLIQHIINNKGKQIRPIITLLTAKALRYKKKKHITIATLIEFIHIATLLHDDVIDSSKMRHGKITTNIIFGNTANILTGDFIYTRAFQMMTELKSLRILSLIANSVNLIAEGEAWQLMYCNDPDITIKKYMKVIYNKTARLFEVASQTSAILSNANSYQEKALRNYGRYVGIAFQLIDDLLDYDAPNIKDFGKNIGNDLNEGKPTLPLLHAIRNSSIQQASIIRKAIQKGNHHHLFNIIYKIMKQYGSLQYTKQHAEEKINKAISYLTVLPSSPYKQALKNLANFIILRNN